MNKRTIRQLRVRSGVALVLVISAVALAAVLGFALLSGGMLQTRTSGNASKVAQADYLAESGVNLALYYLENPDKAPSLNGSGYWGGGTYTIGSSSPALSVTVSVQRDASETTEYEISSTGTVGSSGETQMTRTMTCRASVTMGFRMKYAAGSVGSLNVNAGTTLDGDVIAQASVVLRTGSVVTGKVYAPGMTVPLGYSNPPSNPPVPDDTIAAPNVNDVSRYSTYTYNGVASAGETISSSVTSLPSASAPMTAGSTNPGNVWISDGNLTLGNNVVLNGTLVVKGNLTINGSGIVITPKAGMPAVIVVGSVTVNHPSKNATFNGVTYIGGQLKHGGVLLVPADASVLNINGGLLLGASSTPIATTYNVKTNIKMDSSVAKVPDLSTTGRSALSVSVERWGSKIEPAYTVVNAD